MKFYTDLILKETEMTIEEALKSSKALRVANIFNDRWLVCGNNGGFLVFDEKEKRIAIQTNHEDLAIEVLLDSFLDTQRAKQRG